MGFQASNFTSRAFLMKTVQLVRFGDIKRYSSISCYFSVLCFHCFYDISACWFRWLFSLGKWTFGGNRAGWEWHDPRHPHQHRLLLHCPRPDGRDRHGGHKQVFSMLNTHNLVYLSYVIFQLCLFNLFGFLFYLSAGSSQISVYRSQHRPHTVSSDHIS